METKIKLMLGQVISSFSIPGVIIAVYALSSALKVRLLYPVSMTAFIACLLIEAIFSYF